MSSLLTLLPPKGVKKKVCDTHFEYTCHEKFMAPLPMWAKKIQATLLEVKKNPAPPLKDLAPLYFP